MSEDQGGPEGLNPEVLPGPAVEPPNGEQANHGDDSTPPPGSLALFKEQGNPKFPKALLVGGGFDILANPICSGMSEWLVSASVLDLNTSIEGVLLLILHNAYLIGTSLGRSCSRILIGFLRFSLKLDSVKEA